MLDNLPPVTRALLLSNGAVFLLQMFMPGLFIDFMLWPWGEYPVRGTNLTVGFLPWQLISYGFLHGGLGHLFLNMFAVFMFGAAIEQLWGAQRFGIYYFACVAGAGLVQLVVVSWSAQSGGGVYPTVGASGGVFGLLLAFAMFFPNQRIMMLFLPVPIKAKYFVLIYGAIELLMGITNTQSGVAHFAHLGGMAFGFILIQYWRGRWPFERRPR